jgi:hypothetical protein
MIDIGSFISLFKNMLWQESLKYVVNLIGVSGYITVYKRDRKFEPIGIVLR